MGEEDSRSSAPGHENQSSAAPVEGASSSELREDQIQNAVAFLSHPKVCGSPKASKVSFLQQKGLTQAEIDEAFRRVPETPVPTLPTPTQQQPNNTINTIANHVAPPQQHYPLAMHQQQHPQERPVRWSQVALGAGFAAASAYAVKSLVWPFVADKYAAWRGTSSSISPYNRPDAAVLAGSDVNAVADAIRAQTAELATSIEALKTLIAGSDKQRPKSPEDKITASEIRQELQTMAASLNEIVAGPRSGSTTHTTAASVRPTLTSLSLETELSEIKNLLSEYLKTPRSGEHTPPGELNATTTPGSYSSAHDRPLSEAPSPIQLHGQTSSGRGSGGVGGATGANSKNTTKITTTTTTTEGGRHPASYMEVLEMLERGETPPGIRDDINDKPPNPEQPPPPARMKPLPKPWERNQGDNAANTMTPLTNFTTTTAPENGGSSGVIDLSPVVPEDNGLELERPFSNPTSPDRPGSGGNRPDFLVAAAGSKGATSIFEAATSSQGSPGVIAGRLSPSSDQRRSGGTVGGSGRGVATPTLLFPDSTAENQAGPAGRPPRLTTTTPLFPDEGGLGRPTSRGWRPPPIPVPTLSPESNTNALPAGGSAASGSQNSLGADFAAA